MSLSDFFIDFFNDCQSIIFDYLFDSCKQCRDTYKVFDNLYKTQCVVATGYAGYLGIKIGINVDLDLEDEDEDEILQINLRSVIGDDWSQKDDRNTLSIDTLVDLITHNISFSDFFRAIKNDDSEFDIHEMGCEDDDNHYSTVKSLLYNYFKGIKIKSEECCQLPFYGPCDLRRCEILYEEEYCDDFYKNGHDYFVLNFDTELITKQNEALELFF